MSPLPSDTAAISDSYTNVTAWVTVAALVLMGVGQIAVIVAMVMIYKKRSQQLAAANENDTQLYDTIRDCPPQPRSPQATSSKEQEKSSEQEHVYDVVGGPSQQPQVPPQEESHIYETVK